MADLDARPFLSIRSRFTQEAIGSQLYNCQFLNSAVRESHLYDIADDNARTPGSIWYWIKCSTPHERETRCQNDCSIEMSILFDLRGHVTLQ